MKKIALIIGLISITFYSYSQNADDSKTHSFKYDFFSPVGGCFGFSLETTRSNFSSIDIDAGLIGLQLGDYFYYDKFLGAYVSAGPRFYFKRDNDLKGTNNFKGGYFKPELLANYFSFEYLYEVYDFNTGLTTEDLVKGSDFSLSLLLCLGNQWVLSDIVTFDIWFGLGYGGNWVNDDFTPQENDTYFEEQTQSYKFSYVKFGDSPLIFDGGLSIGILLK